MKNMISLILRDVYMTYRDVVVKDDNGLIVDADEQIEHILESLKIIQENLQSLCEDSTYLRCVKILERQLMYYEETLEIIPDIEQLLTIINSYSEVLSRYDLMV